jgi:hypothetical protein
VSANSFCSDDFPAISLHAAAVAQRHGLDVKAVEVEGDHGTAIPRATKRSVAFFDKYPPE